MENCADLKQAFW